MRQFLFIALSLMVTLSACTAVDPNAQTQKYDENVPPEVLAQHKGKIGFVLKRSYSAGYAVEQCDTPDEWTKNSKGKTAYCFEQSDVRYAFNKNLLPGVKYQYQGPQYGKQLWDNLLVNAGRGIEQNYDNNVTLGPRNLGGVNALHRFAKTDEYKRTCMEKFMDNPNAIINGVLRQTPAQLGSYDTCVNQLRTQTTIESTGGINIKF